MFDEDQGQYVPTRTKALKRRVWNKNLNVYRKRRAESEKALADYTKRLRGDDVSDVEVSDSDDDFDYIQPDESDVELSLIHRLRFRRTEMVCFWL